MLQCDVIYYCCLQQQNTSEHTQTGGQIMWLWWWCLMMIDTETGMKNGVVLVKWGGGWCRGGLMSSLTCNAVLVCNSQSALRCQWRGRAIGWRQPRRVLGQTGRESKWEGGRAREAVDVGEKSQRMCSSALRSRTQSAAYPPHSSSFISILSLFWSCHFVWQLHSSVTSDFFVLVQLLSPPFHFSKYPSRSFFRISVPFWIKQSSWEIVRILFGFGVFFLPFF